MNITKETENYIFYCEENSLAHKEINEIAQTQEKCHNHICKVLGIKSISKIHYYLCDSPEHVGVIYGDNEPCNAFNDSNNSIYAVYNLALKCIGFHEDAHIISYMAFGVPKYLFIREGLAMYFDRVWLNISNEVWTQYYFRKHDDLIVDLFLERDSFHKLGYMITYPISGAFTEYLIMVYGKENYIRIYSELSARDTNVFEEILGDTIEKIFIEFQKYISLIRVNKKTFEDIDKILNQ